MNPCTPLAIGRHGSPKRCGLRQGTRSVAVLVKIVETGFVNLDADTGHDDPIAVVRFPSGERLESMITSEEDPQGSLLLR